MEQDYYRILGVDPKASAAELRRAYLKLVRREHPDVNPGDREAAARYAPIREAWRVLSNKDSREEYDRRGRRAAAPSPGADRARAAGRGRWESVLSEVFPEAPSGEHGIGPARGEDVHLVVEVGFEEAMRGVDRECGYQREVPCAACGGRRWAPGAELATCGACAGRGVVEVPHGPWSVRRICPSCAGEGETGTPACGACGGRGRVPAQERRVVAVPAGAASGARLVVPGAGQPGRRGGEAGDLVVTVRVHPHPRLERKGQNLFCTVEVTLAQAVLGGALKVPAVEGTRTIRLPPGTQCGQQFALRGRGVPEPGGGKRGDLVVTVAVRIPSGEDPRVRRAMLALQPALPGAGRGGAVSPRGRRRAAPAAPPADLATSRSAGTERDMPLYMISVVAELLGVHPQTLRLYEREGYVAPRRTRGGTRLYSERDVEEVRRILHLTRELGVNLAGVEVVLEMRRKMERLQGELEDALEFVRREVKREVERQRSRTALVRVGRLPARRGGGEPGGRGA